MRALKIVYALAGAALFAALLVAFDAKAAAALVWQVGALGVLGLSAAYFLAFTADNALWLVCLPEARPAARWFWRLTRVRLVGEAYNLVMPAGGFGGEPVKAVLLKNRYGVGYRSSSASIVLVRLINTVGQLVFVAVAFVLMAALAILPAWQQASAWAGFAVLAAMTAAFVLLPVLRLASRLARWLERKGWGRGIAKGLAEVEAVETLVGGFAARDRRRYALATLIGIAHWTLGVGEMWLALHLLGHPVSLPEAMVIEAVLQLARTVSFFVPANLGTQDGAVAITVAALTGSPAAGLGAALLRRVREVIYTGAGFAVGGWYSWRTARPAANPASTAGENERPRDEAGPS